MGIRNMATVALVSSALATGVFAWNTAKTINSAKSWAAHALSWDTPSQSSLNPCPIENVTIHGEHLSDTFFKIFSEMEAIKEKQWLDAMILSTSWSYGDSAKNKGKCAISEHILTLIAISENYDFQLTYYEPEQNWTLVYKNVTNQFSQTEVLELLRKINDEEDIEWIAQLLNENM